MIGDVHGCLKTLLALVAQFPKDVPITFCGDLIDRGPDSRGVVKFVRDNGYDCVKGNHEVMMWNYASQSEEEQYAGRWEDPFLDNGGDKTITSYVDKGVLNDFYSDAAWMNSLPYYILYDEVNENGDKLLVSHTNADTAWKYPKDSREFKDLITWDRSTFPGKIEGMFQVYGHTPQKDGPTIKAHFANIDTGAVFKRGPYGKLTALQWPEMIVYEQKWCETDEEF